MATPSTIRNRETTFEADRCRALARALIAQAFQDAVNTTTVHPLDHRHARAFLTAPDGEWAWSRRFWASMAEIPEGDIRERAERAIERGVDWKEIRNGALR